MILPIILHHDTSAEYTNQLKHNLGHIDYCVYDSSVNKTHFTESFNRAIQEVPESQAFYDYVMICNNDISLTARDVEMLEVALNSRKGIFSPALNSPHWRVMSREGNESLREVPFVEFECHIIHREVIKAVGLLDEGMPRGWGIELDYCYRAKMAGFGIYLVQDIAIYNYGHKSQVDHGEYSHYANIEMNDRLRE
ncbi:MAG: glycosyltransferase family 2 protein, partial [Minisyncoccia bacterium]